MVSIVIALAGALWLTYGTPFVFCRFLQQDAMDATFCGTLDHLGDYDARPDGAIAWLMTNHGAAPSQQVMYLFVNWAFTHEEDFLDILNRIDDHKIDRLLDRISSAVTQSGQDEEFRATFEKRAANHRRLGELIARISSERRSLSSKKNGV
jgi:hypothetical protein